MNEQDKILLDILLKEKEIQRQSLRTLDSSLHTVAFAYIAAFALCVPALLTRGSSMDEIAAIAPFVGTILCTILFIGAFYALMLIRSRNVHLAHIAFLSDRINEIVSRNYGERSKVLFQQSTEISGFYYGKAKGKVWFAMYAIFLLLIVVGCCYVVWASLRQGAVFGFIVVFEIVSMAGLYYTMLKSGGIRPVRERIEHDYENWITHLDEQVSLSDS